jgi:hypothetical protein|tara:strand:+ start:132 stop:401 length:270 start_codon:yes stop_codon:yes gene_type:complete
MPTRKIKLRWSDDAFSLCKGEILGKNSYKGRLMCWTRYNGHTLTYLIYPYPNHKILYTSGNASFDKLKKYIDGESSFRWYWHRVTEKDN